jgi:centrosomal protein CEP104
MTEVAYHVVYATSEELGSSARLLHLPSVAGHHDGWASARFCFFPQDLVLRFAAPVSLREIKVLSHHTRIASVVELHLGRVPSGCKMPLVGTAGVQFEPIGHFCLSENAQSDWRARELRTVHVPRAADCQFLRLRLHQCHINDHNWYNQVGIIAIHAFGHGLAADLAVAADIGDHDAVRAIDAAHPAALVAAYTATEGGDYFGVEMARALDAEKATAAAANDFDEAKRLKHRVAELARVGAILAELEAKKRAAVEQQRYEVAGELKDKLRALRAAHGIPQPPPPASLPPPAIPPPLLLRARVVPADGLFELSSKPARHRALSRAASNLFSTQRTGTL